ncbi:inositol 1,4,5-trisphosphate receptor-interacting protein-like 2 [Protopterus annectens]|uniref:inositol 1,4,5-trisphosphate receptor-interacting protein-like 2 n=1 Tax=Protopterus annectens TaxID=7888 RepID=UPI001CFBCE5A|nr:inositol 1,4,5-trisphosphate receptor-interacting protein-like 2 [Protopterus annectens]
MSTYSLNLRVFWPLVTCLCTAVLCLYHALKRRQDCSGQEDCNESDDETGSFPLFKFSLVFLVCYFLIKYFISQEEEPRQLLIAADADVKVPPVPEIREELSAEQKLSLLQNYYDHQIRLSPHVLGHSKAHVNKIVSELVKVGRTEHQDATVTFRGDFVQIGSAYEQHKINSPNSFDILIPLKLPPTLQLQIDFGLHDMGLPAWFRGNALCKLRAPKRSEWGRQYKNFSDSFCMEMDRAPRHLSSALVLKWFYSKMQRCLNVIRYRFEERCHITLSVVEDKLILKILPKSDYVCCHISMSVRLIPAIHVGDSVFLIAQPWGRTNLGPYLKAEIFWSANFSKQEQKLLSWLKTLAPDNSCHLKCLQIVKALRDLKSSEFDKKCGTQWRAILSSYILKTALFHLLLQGNLESWDDKFLLDRIGDLIEFLKDSLQKQCLMHLFLGSSTIPDIVTVPKSVKEASPVNLLAGFDRNTLDTVSLHLLHAWKDVHILIGNNNVHKNVNREFAGQDGCSHQGSAAQTLVKHDPSV